MKALIAATAALALSAASADALPSITPGDTMNIAGNATFDGTNVNFTNPADLLIGTGDYVALGTCTSCVVVNTPLEYTPFANLANLFVVTNNGITATVSITGQIANPSVVGNDLSLNDDALLTLTGFAPTVGTLELTVNQATGVLSGSFSSTVQGAEVPEPAGFAVLGVGVLGLAAARRRRPIG